MSKSELNREDNIARNRKLLNNLEIGPGHTSIFEDIDTSEANKAPVTRKAKKSGTNMKSVPTRHSLRQQQPDSGDEHSVIMASPIRASGGTNPVTNNTRGTDNITPGPANNETRVTVAPASTDHTSGETNPTANNT